MEIDLVHHVALEADRAGSALGDGDDVLVMAVSTTVPRSISVAAMRLTEPQPNHAEDASNAGHREMRRPETREAPLARRMSPVGRSMLRAGAFGEKAR